ncbi:hypothetical protein BC749_10748 [Flavobacterium araucananum]|nr:hypothetical protein BC749_10748 [Flavobacterium araucananum]
MMSLCQNLVSYEANIRNIFAITAYDTFMVVNQLPVPHNYHSWDLIPPKRL